MPDDMNTRLMKAEWKIETLEAMLQKQSNNMSELSSRIESHHKELMTMIGSLKDDRARAQGAAEARLLDSETRQNRLKMLSFGLAVIGTLVALGWFGEAKAVTVGMDSTDAPIPVQYYTRDLP